MSSHPYVLAAILTLALLLSRPWLEARRPILLLVLILGFMLGNGGLDWVGPDLRAGLAPVLALAAGWLALLAAESWDLSTLRRSKAWVRLGLSLLLAIAATVVVAAETARRFGLLEPVAAGFLIVAACLAQDPDAARDSLARSSRPDARSRLAPLNASIALGAALLLSSVAQVPAEGGVSRFHIAPDLTSTITLGAVLGVVAALALRLAEGSGMLLSLLAALAVAGSGLALRLDLSPCALLFCAGVVLANDSSRRDLVFALLRQWERPALCALLFLVGASLVGIPAGAGEVPLGTPLPAFFLLAAGLLLTRMVISWGRWREALAFPPLVLALTLSTGTRPEVTAIAMALVAGEVILLAARRRAANDSTR